MDPNDWLYPRTKKSGKRPDISCRPDFNRLAVRTRLQLITLALDIPEAEADDAMTSDHALMLFVRRHSQCPKWVRYGEAHGMIARLGKVRLSNAASAELIPVERHFYGKGAFAPKRPMPPAT